MAHETKIGKDLIQMLMFSLYPESATIYREYLQNACDSINAAVKEKILAKKEDGHIIINIDKYKNQILISDNGIGIPHDKAESRLKDIASSEKKANETFAGFYGIGRLVGAGYCKMLKFRTSSLGDSVGSELVFDVEKIRDILDDDNNMLGAADVIDEVSSFAQYKEKPEEHYFTVEFINILPDYPELLDTSYIQSYLEQVAPIGYSTIFKNNLMKKYISDTAPEIQNYYNLLNTVHISLNDSSDIRKKYGLKIEGTNDEIISIRFFLLKDPKYGDLAWGWYAITPFEKQIPELTGDHEPVQTIGMRLRCYNIQIGNEKFFDGTKYFKQARSNKYFNGEIHIIHPKIIPTPDRSDLAPTSEAICFKEKIKELFNGEMQKVYQSANKIKKAIERFEKKAVERKEIEEIEPSSNFTQEQKEEKIRQLTKEQEESQTEIENFFFKPSLTLGEKAMKEGYEEKYKKTQAIVSSEKKLEKKVKEFKKERESTPQVDIFEELYPLYSDSEMKMIKRIFNIIDSRFYKDSYENFIRTVKAALLKDLKKKND